MIFTSRKLSDQITDADEACRSSEISVNLIIIIVFFQTYSYCCYILTSFFMLCCILDIYLSFLFVCTESLNTCFRSDIPQVHTLATFTDVYIYIHIIKLNNFHILRFVVLNATFNNISVISWRSVLFLSGKNH